MSSPKRSVGSFIKKPQPQPQPQPQPLPHPTTTTIPKKRQPSPTLCQKPRAMPPRPEKNKVFASTNDLLIRSASNPEKNISRPVRAPSPTHNSSPSFPKRNGPLPPLPPPPTHLPPEALPPRPPIASPPVESIPPPLSTPFPKGSNDLPPPQLKNNPPSPSPEPFWSKTSNLSDRASGNATEKGDSEAAGQIYSSSRLIYKQADPPGSSPRKSQRTMAPSSAKAGGGSHGGSHGGSPGPVLPSKSSSSSSKSSSSKAKAPPSPVLHLLDEVLVDESSDHSEDEGSSLVEQKQTEADAIVLFNDSFKKGIRLLIDLGVVQENPESIAFYMHECKQLDKRAIGDYLGERDDFILEILNCFVMHLDFTNDTFEKALRRLLSCFRLPGESQKIERIMETFAHIFTTQTKHNGFFKHADTAFVLAYSTIMLNTDLHNPQVKTKMTLEQFVSNNRGIDQGEDLPLPFLSELYHHILENEIKMEGEETFPNALKRGPLIIEHKQAKLGKGKRQRRHFVFDEDLTLYQFKSIKHEGGTPLATLSLKDGVTVERRGEEVGEKEKKKEYVLTLYQTLTPEDTNEGVLSSSWKLIAPNASTHGEWISMLEEHAMCIVTSHPPTVGVKIDDDVIAPLNHRVKDIGVQISFLQRNLLQLSQQINAVARESRDMSSQLRDFEQRVHARDPNSGVVGCLSLVVKMLQSVRRFSLNLESELLDSVRHPLVDLSNAEICAGKEFVTNFIEILNVQSDIKEKLAREIQAQSNQNKADQQRFQKIFAESQRLDKILEIRRSGTREILGDTMIGCDLTIMDSFYQMIDAYKTFFSEGALCLNQIAEEAAERQKNFVPSSSPDLSPSPSSLNLTPSPSSLSSPSSASFPLSSSPTPNVSLLSSSSSSFSSSSSPSLSAPQRESRSISPIQELKSSQECDSFQESLKGVKSGTLFKKKKKKRDWVPYYFTLKRKYLFFFESCARNLEFKGALMLKNCSVFAIQMSKPQHQEGFQFAICSQIGTDYFSASSADECKSWIEDIEKCIVNEEGFVGRSTPETEEEFAEVETSFRKQKDMVASKKKNVVKLQMTQKLKEQGVDQSTQGEMFLDDADIIKQGNLHKRGEKVKNWTQRWFALKNNILHYYEVLPTGQLKLKGTIHLVQSVVGHSDRELRMFCFEIHLEYRTYYIAARDDEEEREWIEAILKSTSTCTLQKSEKERERETVVDLDSRDSLEKKADSQKDKKDLKKVNSELYKQKSDSSRQSSMVPEFMRVLSSNELPKMENVEIIRTGYLIKKGAMRKNWTTRYFELRKNTLTYYRSPNEAPKGVIILEAASKVTNLHEKKPFSFTISNSTAREYWVAASDAAQSSLWIETIGWCIEQLGEGDGEKGTGGAVSPTTEKDNE